ncbi:TIGR02234 family membrane protein [Streptacidiphilus sp. MAP5-52]|uniref:TIGR02234 family membrane protein n=1 Tax=Streptacidiphilus sp. MAP5-52 TaxID=3156267 RepID=UPI0035149F70
MNPEAPAPSDPSASDSAASDPAASGPAAAAPSRSGSRRSLAVTLFLSVLGAALLLVAAGQGWVSGEVQAQGVTRTVTADGGEVSGLPGAMALVGLASVVAVFAVRGRARAVLGALVALAGAGAAYTAVAAMANSGSSALDAKAARAIGLANVSATGISDSAWPWVAVLGGVLLVLAGLLTVAKGAAWPGMSARYDAPAGAEPARPKRAPAAEPTHSPADLWKALDRGEDPTAG